MTIKVQMKYLVQIILVVLFVIGCNAPPKNQTSFTEKKEIESPIVSDTFDALPSKEIENLNIPEDTTSKKKHGKRYYLLNAPEKLTFTGVNYTWNEKPQKGDVSIYLTASYTLDFLSGGRTGPFGLNFRYDGDERIGLDDLNLTHQETYYLACAFSESGLVPIEIFKSSDEIPGKTLINLIVVELKDNRGRLHWLKTNEIYQTGFVN